MMTKRKQCYLRTVQTKYETGHLGHKTEGQELAAWERRHCLCAFITRQVETKLERYCYCMLEVEARVCLSVMQSLYLW